MASKTIYVVFSTRLRNLILDRIHSMYKQSKPRKILNYSHDRVYERMSCEESRNIVEFPDIPHRSLCRSPSDYASSVK